MTKERVEGQPKATLFPLSEEALMTASRALNDALKDEDIIRTRSHIQDILGRPYVSPFVRNFFDHRHREMPEEAGIRNFYSFGAVVSLDGIGFQSALDGKSVTPMIVDDLNAYKKIRSKLIGMRWFTGTDDVLASIERQLSRLLSEADDSYRSAAEEIEKKDRGRVVVMQNIAFLLGLSDMYFPFRYADERVKIMESSD